MGVVSFLLCVLFAAAAVAVVWFRAWPRRPAEGTCGGCGYASAGLSVDRCPECGGGFGARRGVQKRWVVLAAALALLAVQSVWWSSRDREPWYTRLVPTTAIYLLERIDPADPEANGGYGSFRFGLMRSREDAGAWGWQTALAAAGRVSEAMVESCLVTPEVWPEGEPIVVRLRWPQDLLKTDPSFPQWGGFNVAIHSALTPDAQVGIGFRARGVQGCNFGGGPKDVMVLPAQPVGEFETRFDVSARVSFTTVADREVVRRIRIVARGTPILKPVDSPELRRVFVDSVYTYPNAAYVSVQPPTWALKGFPDVAMGTKVELLWKGKPFGEFRSPRTNGDEWQYFDLPEGAKEGDAAAERTTPIPAELTVRMTGDELAALRQLKGTSYWSGSIEMPMAEWISRQEAAFAAWKKAHP
ncbi:MAG: hypothetical protein QM783_19910 [Phycisphaerales bacterium]